MDYKNARISIFPFQFGIETAPNYFNKAWLHLPRHVLNKIIVHSLGEPVTYLQGNIKKELVILPFFNSHYETMLGEEFFWADPLHVFVNDVEEILRKQDPVVWILTGPKAARQMEQLFQLITPEVCLFEGIKKDTVYSVFSLPNCSVCA
jgi:hypothetical protein